MNNITITLLNSETVEVKMIREYDHGRLCFDCNTDKFYVVDKIYNIELDMDVTELVTCIKPWKNE